MRMRILFPGGLGVDAETDGHLVHTDHPPRHGGSGSAPPPFDLFLASIGTCAGFYALRFCQQRGIDTAELGMTLEALRGEDGKRVQRIRIAVDLPAAFPARYHAALIRAIDLCAVKRHILEPPEFEVALASGAIQPDLRPDRSATP